MRQEKIELTELIASEGMLLTNGEVVSDIVFLGINDSPDNWWEIPMPDGSDEE